MARIILNALAVLAALAAAFYQFYLKDMLVILGYNRVVQRIGNERCQKVPGLRACEKISLHQPSGQLFLACSEPDRRILWLPAALYLNPAGASQDYVAIYDPKTTKITKLKLSGVDDGFDFSSHGMDVVPSASNPSELFVYLVNHRPPKGLDARQWGADSVLEIFKHKIGDDKLTHIKTIQSSLMIAPNDVVGSDDGTSLYFTNDNGQKTGIKRQIGVFLKRKATSVVYCHIQEGCKYAARNMFSNNGIVRASNGTFYVAHTLSGGLSILEEQSDNTLVITDHIQTGESMLLVPLSETKLLGHYELIFIIFVLTNAYAEYPMDNLSLDSEGHVWAAGFPNLLEIFNRYFVDPSILTASCALRFSINTGPNAFYGEKYKVDKVFEDDGRIASGITSVVHDAQRKKLFLHGILASHLTICDMP
ncbi:hypothetical protein D9756_007674 [Leucocoprinus leucothites]|uniref:Serum paraoxonase/arylesterase n=1 Tax=Leucocoprinus leucothites TaxID=201217 RepID=A0A8H5D1E8_9AGAR|nr:hypothetical protein D9756_007674 [Leucoagaricus leucothites]